MQQKRCIYVAEKKITEREAPSCVQTVTLYSVISATVVFVTVVVVAAIINVRQRQKQ